MNQVFGEWTRNRARRAVTLPTENGAKFGISRKLIKVKRLALRHEGKDLQFLTTRVPMYSFTQSEDNPP